jgi:N-acetylmuramoyl-L-alanine amidase
MRRIACFFLSIWLGCTAGAAQDLSGLARVDVAASSIADTARGVEMVLSLSQGVPYRVYTLDAPRRLVVDFREVDWQGVDLDGLDRSERVVSMRAGTFRPGWSRLVAGLSGPMGVTVAALETDQVTGRAVLRLGLEPQSADAFAAASGAPHDPRWDLPPPVRIEPTRPHARDVVRVMLDPGHGGIDPGAETGQINEKSLMLTFARELEDVLIRSGGFEVRMTRSGDYFVSLERRIALAHEDDVDIFLSLQADSLADGGAHGATVYVLSDEASDVASAKLAERHDRDQLLSGVDLTRADDQVTGVLLDLARQETAPRTEILARSLVAGMANRGGPMNRRPLRRAAFSVLKAADIPSVLLEIGFLSSPRDLKNLQDPAWRQSMAEGIRDGLQLWLQEDTAMRPLVRH